MVDFFIFLVIKYLDPYQLNAYIGFIETEGNKNG